MIDGPSAAGALSRNHPTAPIALFGVSVATPLRPPRQQPKIVGPRTAKNVPNPRVIIGPVCRIIPVVRLNVDRGGPR